MIAGYLLNRSPAGTGEKKQGDRFLTYPPPYNQEYYCQCEPGLS